MWFWLLLVNSSNILVAAACSWWPVETRGGEAPYLTSYRLWDVVSPVIQSSSQKASFPMTLMQVSKWKKLECCVFSLTLFFREIGKIEGDKDIVMTGDDISAYWVIFFNYKKIPG